MTDQTFTVNREKTEPTTEETTEAEVVEEHVETPAAPQEGQTEDEGGTFPRKYVEELRAENRRYRERAQDRDALAHRLHVALVEKTGRLADPTDLEFDPAHLEDGDALNAALDDLLERKPHLASRRPRGGDVGQGPAGTSSSVSLLDLMRGAAS